MEEKYLTPNERKEMLVTFRRLLEYTRDIVETGEFAGVSKIINDGINKDHYKRDKYGINPALHNIKTALSLCERVSPDRNMILAILLYNLCKSEFIPENEIVNEWG